MPPLLQRLSERKPESLDYLGVSYGLTSQLLRYEISVSPRIHANLLLQLLEEGWICALVHPPNTK